MRTNGYHKKMRMEISKGTRICQMCPDYIRKGEKCISVVIAAGFKNSRGIHIHWKHLKQFDHTKCGHRTECAIGEIKCESPICKFRRKINNEESKMSI